MDVSEIACILHFGAETKTADKMSSSCCSGVPENCHFIAYAVKPVGSYGGMSRIEWEIVNAKLRDFQMLSVLVPSATFLPKVLNALGLPAATFLEEKDDATGLNTCNVSLYFTNDCGRFDDLRTFTASSLDIITNAKHLASLDAIQNLKSTYNFTVVDVSSKELSELKSAQPLPPLVKKIKALSLSNAPESPSASAIAPTLNSGRLPNSKKRNKSIAFSSRGVGLQTAMSEQLERNNQIKNRFFLLARTFATAFKKAAEANASNHNSPFVGSDDMNEFAEFVE